MSKAIQSTTNAHGIKIKVWCASCHHKCVDREGIRVCMLKQQIVPQRHLCRKWQLSSVLKRVGKSYDK